jgi:hypothetical protein
MDDIRIEGVIDPVIKQPAVDPRKAVLDGILETFKANPGKWAKLAVEGSTTEDKMKKVRSMRTLISKLTKQDKAYGIITLAAEEKDGQFNACAIPREIRKRSASKKKKKQQEVQPQQAPQ